MGFYPKYARVLRNAQRLVGQQRLWNTHGGPYFMVPFEDDRNRMVAAVADVVPTVDHLRLIDALQVLVQVLGRTEHVHSTEVHGPRGAPCGAGQDQKPTESDRGSKDHGCTGSHRPLMPRPSLRAVLSHSPCCMTRCLFTGDRRTVEKPGPPVGSSLRDPIRARGALGLFRAG